MVVIIFQINYKHELQRQFATFISGHDASENIGSPTQMMNIDNFHEQLQMKKEQHAGVNFREDCCIRNCYLKKKLNNV